MKISAAVADAQGAPLAIRTLDLEEPRDDEILVRIMAAGICHTDISLRDGAIPCPFPVVLGHEGAGIVERVGARVTKVKPGDHVVLTTMSCGTCAACLRGQPFYCHQLFDLNIKGMRADGSLTLRHEGACVHGAMFRQSSFANYALTAERNTIKVPKHIPFEILAPLGCGVQTGAGAILNVMRPAAGSEVAIFGVGGVGMSAVMAARAAGCTKIIAVDLNPARLELAMQLGATHVINAGDAEAAVVIRELCPDGIEYTLEASGNPRALRQAVDALRMGGTCVLVGAAPHGVEVKLDMITLLNGRKLVGAVMGESLPDTFIPRLIELYERGQLPVDRLISSYAFEDINQAIEDSEHGIAVKAVIRLDRQEETAI